MCIKISYHILWGWEGIRGDGACQAHCRVWLAKEAMWIAYQSIKPHINWSVVICRSVSWLEPQNNARFIKLNSYSRISILQTPAERYWHSLYMCMLSFPLCNNVSKFKGMLTFLLLTYNLHYAMLLVYKVMEYFCSCAT